MRADRLDDWLDVILHLYGDRVIPFDIPAARLAGLLMDRACTTGQAPGFADLATAATAGVRDLTYSHPEHTATSRPSISPRSTRSRPCPIDPHSFSIPGFLYPFPQVYCEHRRGESVLNV